MIAAIVIFVLTLVLVIVQPRGLNIGYSASAGAALALLFGVVSLSDVVVVWHIVWNATASFIAAVIISLLLDEAGFFKWAALHMARIAGGSGRVLFVLVVLLGASVTAVFNNDGAALILTPIVMAMLAALGFGSAAVLAFVMAAGFIADSASSPLVVSNLVNIVSADFFGIGFARYAAVMVPVNFAAIAASVVMLLWVYRRAIPASYSIQRIEPPHQAIRDARVFYCGWWVLGGLLIGFFSAGPLGIPVSLVAGLGALVLLLAARSSPVISTRRVMRNAPWHIVVFSVGMYLVVYGLRNAGLIDGVAYVLTHLGQHGLWAATLGTGFMTATLAAFMNNLPTVLVGALSVAAAHVPESVREAMVYANVVGCDLGPKMTPIGSLATLLWLHVLAAKGLRIGWGYYFKMGVLLTMPVLTVTLAALAWRLS